MKSPSVKDILFLMLFVLLCQTGTARVIIYGDTRSQPEVHEKLVEQMLPWEATTIFHTGDLVSKGVKQEEYDAFFQIVEPLMLKAELYPVKGNHERDRKLFLQNFPELNEHTWFCLEADSLIWIGLDSTTKLSPGSEQYQWLVRQLNMNKSRNIVILLHHCVYSSGEHGDELGLNLWLPDLLERFPVLAVFNGHDHMYEKSFRNHIWYITTAGGGAPLYEAKSRNDYSLKICRQYHFCVADVVGNQLKVNVYGSNGEFLDSFSAELKHRLSQADK